MTWPPKSHSITFPMFCPWRQWQSLTQAQEINFTTQWKEYQSHYEKSMWYVVFFWYFLLAYSWCTILYITGVQYRESQFLNYASFIDLPTQRSNPGLPHCRHILYQLSYQGSHSYYKILAIFPMLYNICINFSIFASIFAKHNLQCILRKSPKHGVHVQRMANQSLRFLHTFWDAEHVCRGR